LEYSLEAFLNPDKFPCGQIFVLTGDDWKNMLNENSRSYLSQLTDTRYRRAMPAISN
jgi:hypothetical protein